MWYEVTIYFIGKTGGTTFSIDEAELILFIRFIIEHISSLHDFNVIRHTIQ